MGNEFEKMTDEQLAVASQKSDGDSAAGEELFRRYSWLVESKTKTYYIVGAERDDVIQEGMIGLYKAMKDYNSEKNASFRTFADMCINRQLISAVKAANRKKHHPLNNSMSIFDPVRTGENSNGERKESTLENILMSGVDFDPQASLALSEILDYIVKNEDGTFSDLELKVWNGFMSGKSKQVIADELAKSVKSVDNALQRTKQKIIKYMYD